MFLINPYIYSNVSYLVDDFSPVVAYSTQKISSSTTNVVRLRRSSDSAESDFSETDLTDGTATTWTGANNGLVAKWYNQGTGGSTYDMAQTTASNQPNLITSGVVETVNGIPSISFDGTNDYLTCANTPLGQTNDSFFAVSSVRVTETFGIILNTDNVTNGRGVRIFNDSTTSALPRNLVIVNTSGTPLYAADMSTTRTAADTLTLRSSFVGPSKGLYGFDNGATGGTDVFTGTWTNNSMQIGREGVGQFYLPGNVTELIGFSSFELTNRTDIETNINDRLSIY